MASTPPPEIAAHAAAVKAWLEGEEAADRARANRGPSAAQRFDDIRIAQAAAAAEGRTLAVPSAPVAVAVAPDPASMSPAERWALMRSHDQSRMALWKDPRA
jgi:hypothetical protein